MNTKSKGSNAERDLLHRFWQHNWACVRTAGSGSMKYDAPDLLVSNRKRILAIECKATKSQHQYFTKEEIFALRSFSHLFGAEPFVGVKFNGMPWSFLPANHLQETQKSFCLSRANAEKDAYDFDALIAEKEEKKPVVHA